MAVSKKKSPSIRSKLRKVASKVTKTAKLGSGKRFKAVMASAKASGAKNPAAVAAAVGRKKYGSKKMAQMAAAGRKRASKKKVNSHHLELHRPENHGVMSHHGHMGEHHAY